MFSMFKNITITPSHKRILVMAAAFVLVFGVLSFDKTEASVFRVDGTPSCTITTTRHFLDNASQVTELHWDSQNATWATIDTIGSVAVHGARSLHVNTTRTYTMTVGNASGKTATCTTAVFVRGTGLKPACTLSVTPKYINGVGRAALSWDTDEADYIALDNNIGVISQYKSGYLIVSPNKTTKYTMTVRDNETGATHYCTTTLYVTGGYYGTAQGGTSTVYVPYSATQQTTYTTFGNTYYNPAYRVHRVSMNAIPYTGASETLYVLFLLLVAGISGVGAYQLRKRIFA